MTLLTKTLRPTLFKCYQLQGLPCSFNLLTNRFNINNLSQQSDNKSNPDIIEIKKVTPIDQFLPIPTTAERLVQKCPTSVQPYLRLMRLHSPTGGLLLLWPGYFALAFATDPLRYPNPTLLALFGIGTILMRGVGCTINDLFDRKFDSKVARTKDRPLAKGEISTPKALAFLGLQSSLALSVLLSFDMTSIILGLSSVGLVCIYPLAKQFTYWPQLILGLTFNWGAILGWSVVTHGNPYLPGVIPLYLACISWTLFYDTIYAYQDRRDDAMIGLKSTAIKFGDDSRKWLTAFSVSMFANLVAAGVTTGQTWPYYITLGLAGFKLTKILQNLDINDPKSCDQAFKENVPIGYLIFCGIVLSTLIKPRPADADDFELSLEELALAQLPQTEQVSSKE